jgi:dihydropteroate synthase
VSGDSFASPHILGVINLSPESPNKDSIAAGVEATLARARLLVSQGAEIIDIGAQSSYFDAPLLPVDEEIARLIPAIQALKSADYLVSVDTFRPEVAQAAIDSGIDILNDSDGFQDPEMVRILGRWGGRVILPYISGASPHAPLPFDIDDPMSSILPFLRAATERAQRAGLTDLLVDPGTGYRYPGITPEVKERYQRKVYEALPALLRLGYPLLVALPRKDERERTLELVRMIVKHAQYVRAHDPTILTEARIAALPLGGEA